MQQIFLNIGDKLNIIMKIGNPEYHGGKPCRSPVAGRSK